jgi:hypothetical protein
MDEKFELPREGMEEFKEPEEYYVPKGLDRSRVKEIWQMANEAADKYMATVEVQNWSKGRITDDEVLLPDDILEDAIIKVKRAYPNMSELEVDQFRQAFERRFEQGTSRDQ